MSRQIVQLVVLRTGYRDKVTCFMPGNIKVKQCDDDDADDDDDDDDDDG